MTNTQDGTPWEIDENIKNSRRLTHMSRDETWIFRYDSETKR